MTFEEALVRIEELEQEVETLRLELAKYEGKKPSGRPVHDERWQQSFDLWVDLYEKKHSVIEIMDEASISRRTYYRYKSYYESLKNND